MGEDVARGGLGRLIDSVRPIGDSDEPRGREWSRTVKGSPFPSEYRAFIDRFGGGYFEGDLCVLEPEKMRNETMNAYSAWGDGDPANNVYTVWEGAPREVELWAWGVSGSADIVCWDLSTADPESWATVVWDQTGLEWSRHEIGFSAFLLASAFDGDLGMIPSGDTIRYLSYVETARRHAEGILAWS